MVLQLAGKHCPGLCSQPTPQLDEDENPINLTSVVTLAGSVLYSTTYGKWTRGDLVCFSVLLIFEVPNIYHSENLNNHVLSLYTRWLGLSDSFAGWLSAAIILPECVHSAMAGNEEMVMKMKEEELGRGRH